MAQGITINGKRLDEVRMPLEPWSERSVAYLCYPKSQFTFSFDADMLRVAIPPLLGMELYRSGVLPQDAQAPVEVAVGGRRKGRFVVADVRYPGGPRGPADRVVLTLARVRRRR
jgi:hypothetical protein